MKFIIANIFIFLSCITFVMTSPSVNRYQSDDNNEYDSDDDFSLEFKEPHNEDEIDYNSKKVDVIDTVFPKTLIHGCPICQTEYCPKSAETCPWGLIPDPCECCSLGLCQLSEGDKCLNATLHPKISSTDLNYYGMCGDDLECYQRTDLRPDDTPESVCECKDKRNVCGTDDKTYNTLCELAATSKHSDKELKLQHWEPCATRPVIITGPEDNGGELNSGIALDCEVSGLPVPSITWEFETNGVTKVLPSDDPLVAIQSRGGPEQYMTTSWVQISTLRHSDAGTYTCVATNRLGEARSSAHIYITNYTV